MTCACTNRGREGNGADDYATFRKYGPFAIGDIVRTYGGGWHDNVGVCYGVVVKSGPKQFEVLWESDHRTRYSQSYMVVERAYPDDPEWHAKMTVQLRTKAGLATISESEVTGARVIRTCK